MSLLGDMIVAGIKGIKFNPQFYEDKKYKVWICMLSPSTCKPCFDLHGKLYLPDDAPPRFPKLHEKCACTVIWYEADINYTGGIRNSSRILYSNDGLVFVTYDHYFTFNQIC